MGHYLSIFMPSVYQKVIDTVQVHYGPYSSQKETLE